jgi:hypothetical protein
MSTTEHGTQAMHDAAFAHVHVRCPIVRAYCILGRGKINAWLARGGPARVFVNFRKFSSCIARAIKFFNRISRRVAFWCTGNFEPQCERG